MNRKQTNIVLGSEFILGCLLIVLDKRFAVALVAIGCVVLAIYQICTLWKMGGIIAVFFPTSALNKKLTEREMLPFKAGLVMVLAPFAMLVASVGVMAVNAL